MKKLYPLLVLSFVTVFGINMTMATIHTITAYTTPTEAFIPSVVNAVCGDTISWEVENGTHTTSSTSIPTGAASWDSPSIGISGFTYVVTVAGTYNYICHPNNGSGGHMEASIIVTCGVPLGLNGHSSKEHAMVYPNPFSSQLTFDNINGDLIQIYNVVGKQIKSIPLAPKQTSIEVDVADLSKGLYFYSILKNGVVVESRKLVKS